MGKLRKEEAEEPIWTLLAKQFQGEMLLLLPLVPHQYIIGDSELITNEFN